MEQVKVNSNFLKLLSETFFHIQPLKLGIIRPGEKYKCETEAYGIMGEIEVISHFNCHLYDLKQTVMLLADGHTNTQERLKDAGAMSMDGVQCVIFRFKRRNDGAFNKMLNGELSKAGVTITKQSILF